MFRRDAVSAGYSPVMARDAHKSTFSLVLPMAGRDEGGGFRAFETARGETLMRRAVRSFEPFRDRIAKVHGIVLAEQEARFGVAARMATELAGIPFDLTVLDAPTAGPAETVARGVRQGAILGPAIVCDIDHRLDVAPLFGAIGEGGNDGLVSLWPLAGEDLKRWSVAALTGAGDVVAVADNRLPAAAGSFTA